MAGPREAAKHFWGKWLRASDANRGRSIVLVAPQFIEGISEENLGWDGLPWQQLVAIKTDNQAPLPYVLAIDMQNESGRGVPEDNPPWDEGVSPLVKPNPMYAFYAGFEDPLNDLNPADFNTANFGVMKIEYGLAGAPQVLYADIRAGTYALPASSEVKVFVRRWTTGADAEFDQVQNIRVAAMLTPWWMGAQTTPLIYTSRAHLIEADNEPVEVLTPIPQRAIRLLTGDPGGESVVRTFQPGPSGFVNQQLTVAGAFDGLGVPPVLCTDPETGVPLALRQTVETPSPVQDGAIIVAWEIGL